MVNTRAVTVLLALGMSLVILGSNQRVDSAPPTHGVAEPLPRVTATAPIDASKSLRLQNGFRAELIAAEPLVTDPIAMQYDENGLGYVVEMNDYPYTDKSHDRAWTEQTSAPMGRLRVLEDTDGNGTFDKSTVFADKLSWPSGIAPWKGGVYVAATPDVLYLKDLDGDRRADIRRKVFTGFRKYNVQAVMNNLQWGLDHRIYAAGSSNGGNISSMGQVAGQTSDQAPEGIPARMGRNDFRFDPRTERFEVISGGARFGHTWDDWGNRFLCDIRNPIQHVVLSNRYVGRNSFLAVKTAINDVAKSGDAIPVFQISPAESWRTINARRLANDAATKSPYDSKVAKGFVTSCSGVTIYRGAAYPEEFYGNAFIGEVAGNLVMRYRLKPSGLTFEGTRANDQVDFLASTDNWFRPVNFVNAPDGMLHVLDMYRETIEHPWSMPDDLKAQVDLTSGRDRGRIYRLVPPTYRVGFQKPPQPRLGAASIAQLVAELENPNSWWRETAHRLIFERQDREAITSLREMMRDSQSAIARLHALWSLNGLDALSDDDLNVAVVDSDPHVREHAIRLSEPRLKDDADLFRSVLAGAFDENIRVRFQTALTLGEVDDERSTAALAWIAKRDVADPWSRIAVLSSLAESSVPFLLAVLDAPEFGAAKPGRELIGQLAFGIGARNDVSGMNDVLAALVRREGRKSGNRTSAQSLIDTAVVMNLGAGLRRAGRNLEQLASDANSGGRLIQAMLDDAQRSALAKDDQLSRQVQAIEMVGLCSFASARKTLLSVLGAQRPREIQSAAILALTEFPNREVADMLLNHYSTLTPKLQTELVSRLLTRNEWVPSVFDAIEADIVSAEHISPVRRRIYMNSRNSTVRARALDLFHEEEGILGLRKKVIAKYQSALTLPSDPSRGKVVLKRVCLNCHRLGKEGHEVGPDLSTIQHRSPAELLVSVLDPNREVSPNYMQYVVLTQDGRTVTGIIASETPTSITLQMAEGTHQTILRNEIDELNSSGISLMPEGLEKEISPQEMADLIAHLLSNRK